MAKESPEEKLMRMMQKSAPSAAGKPSSFPFKKKFKFALSINMLNMILFLGIGVCLLLFFGLEIPSGCALLKQSVYFPPSKAESSSAELALPKLPGADYYLRPVNERNIFKPYVAKAAAKPETRGMAQLMSRFKLVGIAWLDLPETASVMIEDTQKHTTTFLKQGEQVEGVTVKAIYTDRAVFSHENEETTIKL